MSTITESKQEQAQSMETGVILVDSSEVQRNIYTQLSDKFRLVDTLKGIAEKGFNQQLKSAVNSAIARQKTLYTDADRAGNLEMKERADKALGELEKMVKQLR